MKNPIKNVMQYIFLFLGIRDIASITQVCSVFYMYVRDESFWKMYAMKHHIPKSLLSWSDSVKVSFPISNREIRKYIHNKKHGMKGMGLLLTYKIGSDVSGLYWIPERHAYISSPWLPSDNSNLGMKRWIMLQRRITSSSIRHAIVVHDQKHDVNMTIYKACMICMMTSIVMLV